MKFVDSNYVNTPFNFFFPQPLYVEANLCTGSGMLNIVHVNPLDHECTTRGSEDALTSPSEVRSVQITNT